MSGLIGVDVNGNQRNIGSDHAGVLWLPCVIFLLFEVVVVYEKEVKKLHDSFISVGVASISLVRKIIDEE